jgi:oligopeptidase A
MQYADNRDLRARMYRAYATRASEFGKAVGQHAADRPHPALRAEEAKMLGFANFAEVSLVPKMAESPAQVIAFLRDLALRPGPSPKRDLAELRAFARNELGLDELEVLGHPGCRKSCAARYAFSEHEVKQYFPEPKVLAGLFRVIEGCISASPSKPDTAPVWHPDVRFFRIERAGARGELVGQFYLDLYARDTKRGGAWMDEAITRRRLGHGMQTPVAYLNCNFRRPGGRQTQTRHLQPRRRDHAVPRIRPRPAPPADPR